MISEISKADILDAITEIKTKGIPQNRRSDKYFLLYNGSLYPPKYVLSLAHRFAKGIVLEPEEFSGGDETNSYLTRLGFTLVNKPSQQPGKKWLAVASPENWEKGLKNGVLGVDENRSGHMKKVKVGDELLIYLTGMKIAAICRVTSGYYYDDSKLWQKENYPHRVKFEPTKLPQTPVEIRNLYYIYFGNKGAAEGYFGQGIRPLPMNEFSIFQSELARSMNELVKWNSTEAPLWLISAGNEEQSNESLNDKIEQLQTLKDNLSIPPETRKYLKIEYEIAVRNIEFRKRILTIYCHTCAICGLQLSLVEAAHIIPVSEGGSDELTNGIALCSNHHRAFDRGLIYINGNLQICLNSQKIAELSNFHKGLEGFTQGSNLGKKINLPLESNYYPDLEYVMVRLKLIGIKPT